LHWNLLELTFIDSAFSLLGFLVARRPQHGLRPEARSYGLGGLTLWRGLCDIPAWQQTQHLMSPEPASNNNSGVSSEDLSHLDQLKAAEERDLEWLTHVYRGDKERDLTLRAVVAGMLFGGLMALSNLYVGLKSGWGIGVDIAAVIVIFAVFKALRSIHWVKRDFGMLECTTTMTVAVAASWISSAGLVSAVPALTMLTGYEFVWWQLTLFIAVILFLGLFMAIPLKRQMIQVDSLRFPSNIPTGETIKTMYAHGDEGMKKAKAMGIAGLLGMLTAGLRDGLAWIPAQLNLPYHICRIGLDKLTLGLEPSLIFISIGALFGIKVGLSLLAGLILNYSILAPNLINEGIIKHPAPEIKAVSAPQFPLTVTSGDSFSAKLVEMTTEPEMSANATTTTLHYTWSKPTTYNSTAELQRDFSAPTLQSGSPNPFAKLMTFDIFTNKAFNADMLSLKAVKATTWDATLTIPASEPTSVAAALGFQGSPLLTKLDFRDLPGLAAKLKQPSDPVSIYLNSRLSTAGLLSLENYQEKVYNPDNLQQDGLPAVQLALIESLNKILGDKSLYSETRFAGVQLRDSTRSLVKLQAKLEGASLMRLNRALLEDSYPSLLSKDRFHKDAAATQVIGGFRNISAWSLWPGATVLVVGGLLALAFQWRTLGRTFASIFATLGNRKNATKGVLDHLEIPMTWFVIGFAITGLLAMVLLLWLFSIHWWMGLIAVFMTFFLAAVAARAGAEIGINPIGALGKVTQLTYGALAPGNIPANLMTAGVTAGAACSCSDTVGNLKVGHMVGANPRKQFIAQIFGVVAGALLAVPAYFILVPDATALGGDKFPAPSALVWMGVAKVLSQGLDTLPRSAVQAIIVAFIVGVLIVLVDRFFPKARPYTPSPAALGIALTVPASMSIAMFLGAFIVWLLERNAPKWHATYTIPIASGCIAGESIMGVILAVLLALGLS